MKLNRKGYMTIEIILAAVITFVIAFFLIDLTMELSSTTDDAYADTVLVTDKALIIKNIKENIKSDISNTCGISDVVCDKNKCMIEIDRGYLIRYLSVIDNVVEYSTEDGEVLYSKKIDNSLSNITLTSYKEIDDWTWKGYYLFKISGTNIFADEDYNMDIVIRNQWCE